MDIFFVDIKWTETKMSKIFCKHAITSHN